MANGNLLDNSRIEVSSTTIIVGPPYLRNQSPPQKIISHVGVFSLYLQRVCVLIPNTMQDASSGLHIHV